MDEKTTLVKVNEIINTLECMKASGESDDCLWAYIEQNFSEEILSEDFTNQLIDSGICLDRLAHLSLYDSCLIKLFQKDPRLCQEAGLTLIDKYLQDNAAVETFYDIFSVCCDEYTVESLFLGLLLRRDLSPIKIQKYQSALDIVKQKFIRKGTVYRKALRYESFLRLLFTADESYIREEYKNGTFIEFMAISLNENTPKEILKELACLKKTKYAKIIRNNTRQILSMAEKHDK